MSNNATQDAIVIGWIIMLVAIILLLALGFDKPSDEDMYQWATTECSQGNQDACQLERNILTKR